MLPNKTNVLRKRFCQCNAECRWLGQNVDLAAVIDIRSDLVEADDATVITSTSHHCLHLRLALMANTRSDSTALNSSPCNNVSSYSRFCMGNLTINAVKSYVKAGHELSSV